MVFLTKTGIKLNHHSGKMLEKNWYAAQGQKTNRQKRHRWSRKRCCDDLIGRLHDAEVGEKPVLHKSI